MIRRMRFGNTISLALATMLCLGMATASNAAIEPATTSAGNPDALKPIEELEQLAEIRVRGKRLARRIEDAEDDFFKLYNQLNKDNQYDVLCGDLRLDGSLIIQRACVPRFIADIARPTYSFSTGTTCSFSTPYGVPTGMYQDTMSSYHCYTAPLVPDRPPVVAVAMHKREAYLDNVVKVIKSDQRLLDKVRNLDSLYEEMLLAQNRFVKVRATTPVTFDPRLRPR
jgi:hypothetical protein